MDMVVPFVVVMVWVRRSDAYATEVSRPVRRR